MGKKAVENVEAEENIVEKTVKLKKPRIVKKASVKNKKAPSRAAIKQKIVSIIKDIVKQDSRFMIIYESDEGMLVAKAKTLLVALSNNNSAFQPVDWKEEQVHFTVGAIHYGKDRNNIKDSLIDRFKKLNGKCDYIPWPEEVQYVLFGNDYGCVSSKRLGPGERQTGV